MAKLGFAIGLKDLLDICGWTIAEADPDVDVVERAGAHADAGLARPGFGNRHVVVHEHDLRAALLVDPDGAHGWDRI